MVLSSESRSHEKFMHGIKVLMAKNYIDNLSEETRKGMLEKAEQGLWPSFAPLGYLNVDRGIVPDDLLLFLKSRRRSKSGSSGTAVRSCRTSPRSSRWAISPSLAA